MPRGTKTDGSAALAASFRDPDGFVVHSGSSIYRVVHAHAAPSLREFLDSPVAQRLEAAGRLVRTSIPPQHELPIDLPAPDEALIVEHDAVAFPNYAYEWSPRMLRAAALLTLDIAEQFLDDSFILKDAHPGNVMFQTSGPVFLDVLSFERPQTPETVWRPYAQFIRTFLYPLLARRHFGYRLNEIFTADSEGLDTERLFQIAPWWRKLFGPFLKLVTIPTLLSGRSDPVQYRHRPAKNREEAAIIVRKLIAGLRKHVSAVQLSPSTRAVVNYMQSGHTYSDAELRAKEVAVQSVLECYHPADVLDIGCNTGHFSVLAAKSGSHVVSIDRDPDAIDVLFDRASMNRLPIVPLVVNIARPSPATGWMNGEGLSFLDRARKRFDCVLILAILHHLLVSERIPLERVLQLAAEVTKSLIVIEYVDPEDAQFRRIARGRESLHASFNTSTFEAAAELTFRIAGRFDITPTRRIYVLSKRSG